MKIHISFLFGLSMHFLAPSVAEFLCMYDCMDMTELTSSNFFFQNCQTFSFFMHASQYQIGMTGYSSQIFLHNSFPTFQLMIHFVHVYNKSELTVVCIFWSSFIEILEALKVPLLFSIYRHVQFSFVMNVKFKLISLLFLKMLFDSMR